MRLTTDQGSCLTGVIFTTCCAACFRRWSIKLGVLNKFSTVYQSQPLCLLVFNYTGWGAGRGKAVKAMPSWLCPEPHKSLRTACSLLNPLSRLSCSFPQILLAVEIFVMNRVTGVCWFKLWYLSGYFFDPEGRSQNATLVLLVLVVVLVVISSLKIPKALLVYSRAQWNFAYTSVLVFPTGLPSQIFKLISN